LRKYLFVFLCCLLLVACSDEIVFEGNTPEEAIESMERDFVKDITDTQIVEIDDEKKIAIFETSINGEREYFASILEKKNKKWQVREAFGVGNPDTTKSVSSGGNYLEAGFINLKNGSLTPQFINGQYIFKLKNSEKFIWVKVKVLN